MKKIYGLLTVLFTFIGCLFVSGCSNSDKTIKVCASEIPHAKVLNECVKDLVEKVDVLSKQFVVFDKRLSEVSCYENWHFDLVSRNVCTT